MNRELQDFQDLELLLRRHACRADVNRLRAGLSSGYAAWNRRQHRGDVLRFAVAACFFLTAIVVSSSEAQAAPYRLQGDQTYSDSTLFVQEALLQ